MRRERKAETEIRRDGGAERQKFVEAEIRRDRDAEWLRVTARNSGVATA